MAAKAALIGLMERMAPRKGGRRFADEGEPEMDDTRGGASAGEPDDDEAEADEEGHGDEGEDAGGDHRAHSDMALEDLADMAGIAPEDRADFGAALRAFVHAEIAEAMKGGDDPEEEDEGNEDEEPEPEED